MDFCESSHQAMKAYVSYLTFNLRIEERDQRYNMFTGKTNAYNIAIHTKYKSISSWVATLSEI